MILRCLLSDVQPNCSSAKKEAYIFKQFRRLFLRKNVLLTQTVSFMNVHELVKMKQRQHSQYRDFCIKNMHQSRREEKCTNSCDNNNNQEQIADQLPGCSSENSLFESLPALSPSSSVSSSTSSNWLSCLLESGSTDENKTDTPPEQRRRAASFFSINSQNSHSEEGVPEEQDLAAEDVTISFDNSVVSILNSDETDSVAQSDPLESSKFIELVRHQLRRLVCCL